MPTDPSDKKPKDIIVEDYDGLKGLRSAAFEDVTAIPVSDDRRESPAPVAPPAFDGQFEDLTGSALLDGNYDDLTADLSAAGPASESLYEEIMAIPAIEAVPGADTALFAEPVLLGLASGELEATLTAPFSPFEGAVLLQPSLDCMYSKFDFQELDFIGLINIPKALTGIGPETTTEVVETFGGKSEKVEVYQGQDQEIGIIGQATSPAGRFNYLFFPYDSIKFRYQTRPLGELLVDAGVLPKTVLDEVLARQKKLRSVTVGQILAKQAKLDQVAIDNALRKAWHDHSDTPRQLAGEILVSAGLVTEAQVEEALKLQTQIRKKKLGEMLIELKHLSEDQVYQCLAAKFRRRFVDLREVGLSDEAAAAVPRELALKLRVLPLAINQGRLILASASPDVPAVPELLRKYLRRPFELTVAAPSLLKTAIVKKYSN